MIQIYTQTNKYAFLLLPNIFVMPSSCLDMILFLLIDVLVPEHLIFDYEKGASNHYDIDHKAAKMADKTATMICKYIYSTINLNCHSEREDGRPSGKFISTYQ